MAFFDDDFGMEDDFGADKDSVDFQDDFSDDFFSDDDFDQDKNSGDFEDDFSDDFFSDDDFNQDKDSSDFQDDFSDDFIPSDDSGSDHASDAPAARLKFNRAVRKPEPINLSDATPTQVPFSLQFSPAATLSPAYRETPAHQEEPVHQEEPAYQEEPAHQEEPTHQEEPVYTKSSAEYLIEYADCHYKFFPCGTDVNDLNQKYIYALRYGSEWGYSTVIVPVTPELCRQLCFDSGNRQLSADKLREMRRSAIAASSSLPGTDVLNDEYRHKTSAIIRRGLSIDEFEHADYSGAMINCFSSFVRNGRTTKDLMIVQVPVEQPWNVFAWFPVGGIDGAPSNEILMAASRHWNQLCGAVPAVLDCGVVEYFVPNGTPSYEAALQIAREQFAICHERVLCLTRSHTLSELVDTLTKSCVWYLGWK